MSPVMDLPAALRTALTPDLEGDNERSLVEFLGGFGFAYPARSAINIRLLAEAFPLEIIAAVTEAVMHAAMPDMALNNLERISAVVPGAELQAICSNRLRLGQLVALLGSSPFLTNIICRDPAAFSWLFSDLEIDKTRSETEMLLALRAITPPDIDFAALLPLLRRFKYREMLRIATRDLGGLAPLEEVTAELSALAAATLQLACETSRRLLVAEHGLPLLAENGSEAELAVLGMGKFGGRELNFSSDIDLIYFYSADEGETTGTADGNGGLKGVISLHSFFVRQAEMITKAISQVTEDGFVFRVDLGLRPEGKGGDMAVSLRSAEVYYELWGQTWERAAMLKARAVAGSLALGEELLKRLEPFIHRRYLDYSLIEDMMSMKKKIDASLARKLEGEYNIKLGRGGIREIEFFIQALQLVYAGKTAHLREKNSLKSLQLLREAGIVAAEDCTLLADAYRFLRTVEHRIQVVQERQTHNLPQKEEEYLALARRSGFLSADAAARFREELERHRTNVSSVYGNLFLRDEKLKEEVAAEIYLFFDRNADPDILKDMLAEHRCRNVDAAYDHLLLLRDGPPKAHLTERAHRLLEKIGPPLLQEIFASPDPDMALANLERFLNAVGSRSTFYALLAENREVLKLIVSLFGMSEFLSKIFIGHPEILDSMVARTLASAFKDGSVMRQELETILAEAGDFEEQLDLLRRYRHEEFLRIGMNDIYGKLGQTEIASQLTALADACLRAAVFMAGQELQRFGSPQYIDGDGIERPANFAVIGMGKLGGVELNYHSDLDIIYIYDHQGQTDGAKQISNHEYFAKLGQKIILILTTQTREGYVYKLDTRLRPSGNAGPLVTSLDSFKSYHRDEAQVWERQALTKARVVLGGEDLTAGINDIIRHTVYGFSADDSVRAEIHRLRMRMENEIARESKGNYNIKTGRGGMVDVEFIVQFLLLKYGCTFAEVRSNNTLTALKAICSLEIICQQDCQVLLNGYKFLRRLENRLRIVHDHSINDLGGSREYLDMLARRLGYDPKLRHPGEVLLKEYEELTEGIRGVYERVLGSDNQ